MPFQDDRFQFLNGLAYRVGLTQDVNAVLIFLHHLTYTCHMPLDVREPFQYIRFPFFLHLTSSFHSTRCLLFLVQSVATAANCSLPSPTRGPSLPQRRSEHSPAGSG